MLRALTIRTWKYLTLRYTPQLYGPEQRMSVANTRNQNRNKPELSVADCILLQMLHFQENILVGKAEKGRTFPDSFWWLNCIECNLDRR